MGGASLFKKAKQKLERTFKKSSKNRKKQNKNIAIDKEGVCQKQSETDCKTQATNEIEFNRRQVNGRMVNTYNSSKRRTRRRARKSLSHHMNSALKGLPIVIAETVYSKKKLKRVKKGLRLLKLKSDLVSKQILNESCKLSSIASGGLNKVCGLNLIASKPICEQVDPISEKAENKLIYCNIKIDLSKKQSKRVITKQEVQRSICEAMLRSGCAHEKCELDHNKKEMKLSSRRKTGTQTDLSEIFNNQGFTVRPQTCAVYMLDTVSNQGFTMIGSIPWRWLHEEKWRLHTFAKYPHNTVKSAILLAEDGFAYIGSGEGTDDKVICVFCRAVKQGWQEHEDIRQTHRQLSPECPMVTGTNCTNVPLISSSHVSFAQPTGSDVIETDSVSETNGGSAQPIRSFTPAAPNQPIQMATSSVVSSPNGVQTSPQQSAGSQTLSGQSRVGNNQAASSTSQTSSQSGNTSGSSTSHTSAANRTPSSPAVPNSTQPANQTQDTPAQPANQNQNTPSQPPNQTPNAGPNQPPISQNPTYQELGIITERPKRYEYAVRFKRLETFGDWPKDHHLKKEDVADAGFYYAGYGDCARCFYCGGGLRNWEKDDDVWIEHARWFPKCAYIRQRVGQVFVDTVAFLAQDHEKISFDMVVKQMNIDPSAFQIDSKDTPLKLDPAVMVLRQLGYEEKDILPVAASIKELGQILSADVLYSALEEKGVKCQQAEAELANAVELSDDIKIDEELLTTLKQKNNDLRLQTLCKICMDREVAVVFLPCGHMVCCTECASAMKDCPVCRKQVKGIVRAFMG